MWGVCVRSSPGGSSFSLFSSIVCCLSYTDPNSKSFLITHSIHISSQNVLNTALVCGIDNIPPPPHQTPYPRPYTFTYVSTFRESVLITSTSNTSILQGENVKGRRLMNYCLWCKHCQLLHHRLGNGSI